MVGARTLRTPLFIVDRLTKMEIGAYLWSTNNGNSIHTNVQMFVHMLFAQLMVFNTCHIWSTLYTSNIVLMCNSVLVFPTYRKDTCGAWNSIKCPKILKYLQLCWTLHSILHIFWLLFFKRWNVIGEAMNNSTIILTNVKPLISESGPLVHKKFMYFKHTYYADQFANLVVKSVVNCWFLIFLCSVEIQLDRYVWKEFIL